MDWEKITAKLDALEETNTKLCHQIHKLEVSQEPENNCQGNEQGEDLNLILTRLTTLEDNHGPGITVVGLSFHDPVEKNISLYQDTIG